MDRTVTNCTSLGKTHLSHSHFGLILYISTIIDWKSFGALLNRVANSFRPHLDNCDACWTYDSRFQDMLLVLPRARGLDLYSRRARRHVGGFTC